MAYKQVDISKLESMRGPAMAAARSIMEHCSPKAPKGSVESLDLINELSSRAYRTCQDVFLQDGPWDDLSIDDLDCTATSINLADGPKAELTRLEALMEQLMLSLGSWNALCERLPDLVEAIPNKLAGSGLAASIWQCVENLIEWHRLAHLTPAEAGLPTFPGPAETEIAILKRIEAKLDTLYAYWIPKMDPAPPIKVPPPPTKE